MAGAFLIPEVVVFFHNKLYRGNRTSKTSAASLCAFSSINLAPLATFDVSLNVRWDLVLKNMRGAFNLSDTLVEQEISYVVVSPFLHIKTLENSLKSARATIIAGFGDGNMPFSNAEFTRVVEEAIADGAIVCIKI